jgi:hypothetical protein
MSNLDYLFRHVKQVLTQALAEKRGRPRRRKRGVNPSATKPRPKRL